ncbi:MAG: glycine--tRNA ligase subunit beta, partial [Desulfarculaceae bacterium]|nr:glycine--tRNA ligase subunit beta [Desulfarculaceae bacterium]
MNTLLIEIGTEEIPAGYIVPALEAFRDNLCALMKTSRIEFGTTKYFGTPRRLALMVNDVADRQRAETSTVYGPPATVGFDENGAPTIAAEKFARKAGVSVEDIFLSEQDGKNGKYLTVVKEEETLQTADILERNLPDQILSIPFPKRMKWGSLEITFARPVISLTGLFGKRTLNFKVGNVESGNFVFGHQFMAPSKQELPDPQSYESVLESAGVIVDIEKRKALLKAEIEKVAAEYESRIVEDEELLDINTNLVEYPYPVIGRFDDDFLSVPDEVLITAMREHQKYFAVRDDQGALRACFVAVNNTHTSDMKLVANGHERVLRARLSDAKFFWETDLQSSPDEMAEKLKKVTFQADLGTVFEKRERIKALAGKLVSIYGRGNADDLKRKVQRAAEICKADLVSQVVIEFTKLQGIMGRAYAVEAGEDPEVADAVEQHYRPVYSGGRLPENDTARILALADKVDTICGCFSVGLIPTGGADPYALRRQGIGILQIMLNASLAFSLSDLVAESVKMFLDSESRRAETAGQVLEFLRQRMVNMLTDRGFSREAVNSALEVSFDDIPDAEARVKALDRLRKQPDFEPVSVAFKRVENILKKVTFQADLGTVFEKRERIKALAGKLVSIYGRGNADDLKRKVQRAA